MLKADHRGRKECSFNTTGLGETLPATNHPEVKVEGDEQDKSGFKTLNSNIKPFEYL